MTDEVDPTERVPTGPPPGDPTEATEPAEPAEPAAPSAEPAADLTPYVAAPPLVPEAVNAATDADAGAAPADPLAAVDPFAPLEPPFVAEPAPPPGPPIPLVPTRRLLATAFDLIVRSGNQMRRASFYVGAIALGTVAPFVLAVLILELEGVIDETAAMTGADAGAGIALIFLACIAIAGFFVANVEGRNLGILVLGGQMAGRPITTRQALARSRKVFWPTVGAALVVGLVIGVAQAIVQAVVDGIVVEAEEISVVTSTFVAALLGAPFAYTLAGVVLGGVGPIEAIRRSFRVFGVRRWAAVIIVLFESIAFVLVFLGLGAGLDLVIRVFLALGLTPDAGPVGFVLTTVATVAVVFAFGTLLFTVSALTVAPQVVMFLGLTHATIGLDRARPGGTDDPDARRGRARFAWFSAGMILGFILAALGLVAIVAYALA